MCFLLRKSFILCLILILVLECKAEVFDDGFLKNSYFIPTFTSVGFLIIRRDRVTRGRVGVSLTERALGST